ncbi:hypothetical protein A6U98_02215 [Rhizobium sp. WYCCWR10014]|nr:hypothetical protein A6U98_02215 [Rhizobium sp. WYCCWR10014]
MFGPVPGPIYAICSEPYPFYPTLNTASSEGLDRSACDFASASCQLLIVLPQCPFALRSLESVLGRRPFYVSFIGVEPTDMP